jgi:hypothetical protein
LPHKTIACLCEETTKNKNRLILFITSIVSYFGGKVNSTALFRTTKRKYNVQIFYYALALPTFESKLIKISHIHNFRQFAPTMWAVSALLHLFLYE